MVVRFIGLVMYISFAYPSLSYIYIEKESDCKG